MLTMMAAGCVPQQTGPNEADFLWGQLGITPGRFQKPRAIAIDSEDRLYIVDLTARIQVFDADGKYLRGWKTPESKNGRPSGLTIGNAGELLVADTHYYRMLVYDSQGNSLDEQTIGGVLGHAPSEFGFVTDIVQDTTGNYYIAEYGDYDRIQKFSPEGEFLLQWGSHGSGPGEFRRPQNLDIDSQDHI